MHVQQQWQLSLGFLLLKLENLFRNLFLCTRSELQVASNGIKIVNDAYNANPMSTRAAIDLLKSIACDGKRVAVLGDKLELGSIKTESHEEILSYCCDSNIDLVGLAGNRFLTAAKNMNLNRVKKIVHTNDAEVLAQKIVKRLKFNDVILMKGSRAMQMEKVVDAVNEMDIYIPPQEL